VRAGHARLIIGNMHTLPCGRCTVQGVFGNVDTEKKLTRFSVIPSLHNRLVGPSTVRVISAMARGALLLLHGLISPGLDELPAKASKNGLWICGQFACGEPGRCRGKRCAFPTGIPFPQASQPSYHFNDFPQIRTYKGGKRRPIQLQLIPSRLISVMSAVPKVGFVSWGAPRLGRLRVDPDPVARPRATRVPTMPTPTW